jgi:hypothetical protein
MGIAAGMPRAREWRIRPVTLRPVEPMWPAGVDSSTLGWY